MDDMSNKIKNFFKDNIFYIIIAVVSVVYILTGVFEVIETGKTVLQLIADCFLSFIISYFIIETLGLQGIMYGNKSKSVEDARAEHKDAIRKNKSRLPKLPAWCKEKNTTSEEEAKELALLDSGITYEQFKNNNYDMEKLTKKQKRIIFKVKHMKYSKISAGKLTSETSKLNDPLFMGIELSDYRKQQSRTNLFTKIIFTLVFGYYTLSFLDFNWGDVAWKTLQIIMFVAFGLFQLIKNYMYMTSNFVELLGKKTSYLNEFYNDTPEPEKVVEVAEKEEIAEQQPQPIKNEGLESKVEEVIENKENIKLEEKNND